MLWVVSESTREKGSGLIIAVETLDGNPTLEAVRSSPGPICTTDGATPLFLVLALGREGLSFFRGIIV